MAALITNVINDMFHVVWLCSIALEPKHGVKGMVKAGIIGGVVLQALAMVILFGIRGRVPVYLIAYLAAVFWLGGVFVFGMSASHPAKSLFLISAYFCLWTFIYGFISIATKTYAGAGSMEIWALRVILNVLFLMAYWLFFRKRLASIYRDMKSGYGTVAMLSILAFYMMTVLLISNERKKSYDPFWTFLMVSCYIFMVAVYVAIFRFIAQANREYQLKQIQLHDKYLREQLKSYEKIEQDARQSRHDIRHHNLVVMEYARNGDCAGILSYLNEYEEKEGRKFSVHFCGNRAVDNVLSAYVAKARQNGIMVKADIGLWESLSVSDVDLVSILANILENAINGCMQAEGARQIEVMLRQKKSRLCISCENTCAAGILFQDGLPKARGRDGVGVESICSFVEKYKGNVEFFAADGRFTCRVVLNDF